MHKSLILVAFSTSLVFMTAVPRAQAQEQPDSTIAGAGADSSNAVEQQRVLATEDDWISAEINRDEATLRRVIDDRFLYNANNGKLVEKEDLIKGTLDWNLKDETVRDRTVLVDGKLAVVFGTEEQRFPTEGGDDRVTVLRYTSIYAKRGDQWRAIALQMARMRQPSN